MSKFINAHCQLLNVMCAVCRRLLEEAKELHYCEILNVTKYATTADIKKAFKRKAKEFHPDKHPFASEEEKDNQKRKFQQVGIWNCYRHKQDTQIYYHRF